MRSEHVSGIWTVIAAIVTGTLGLIGGSIYGKSDIQNDYKKSQSEIIRLNNVVSDLKKDKEITLYEKSNISKAFNNLEVEHKNLQEKCASSLNTQKNQEIVIAPSIQDSAGAKASRYDSSVSVLESCQIQSGGDVEIMKHPFSMGGKEYKNMVLMKTHGMVSFPTKYKFKYLKFDLGFLDPNDRGQGILAVYLIDENGEPRKRPTKEFTMEPGMLTKHCTVELGSAIGVKLAITSKNSYVYYAANSLALGDLILTNQ